MELFQDVHVDRLEVLAMYLLALVVVVVVLVLEWVVSALSVIAALFPDSHAP